MRNDDANVTVSFNGVIYILDYARNLAKDAKFVEALSLYSISCLDNDENNQILRFVG